MRKMLGLCLYRLGSWMIEKSHPLLGHKWNKGALELLGEYAPIDTEKADQWIKGLGELLDVIIGEWKCTS